MPAIDFPDAGVTAGQTFTAQGKTWEFNGVSWDLVDSQEFIGTGSIVNEKIADGAVTVSKIATGAVTAAKLSAGSVGTSAIATDAVNSDKIAANAVGSSEIANGAITTDKIVNDAVTTDKIASGAVGHSELATGAVTADKISASAVTTEKINNSAVTNLKLANSSITIGSSSVSLGSSASVISRIADLSVDRFLTINQVKEFISLDSGNPGAAKLYFYEDSSVYYFNNPTANFTLDVRGENGGANQVFDQLTSVGQIVTITMLVKNGATPRYLTDMTIDSSSQGRTLYWQSGVVPAAGNANSIDVYTFVIVKRAAATYDVLANQTRFA